MDDEVKNARVELIFVDVDADANIDDIKVLVFHLHKRILLFYLLLIPRRL